LSVAIDAKRCGSCLAIAAGYLMRLLAVPEITPQASLEPVLKSAVPSAKPSDLIPVADVALPRTATRLSASWKKR
jgi:hypothetical protein